MVQQRVITHSVESSTLADIFERVLDKGIVIAGDIKIRLLDVELLTIQIRLVICSVDKAKEMGMDRWRGDPHFSPAKGGKRGVEYGPARRPRGRTDLLPGRGMAGQGLCRLQTLPSWKGGVKIFEL